MSATNYFNRTKIALTIVVVSFVCASTSDAMAQEEGDEEWNIALGGGAALASDLWTGTENEVMPVPYFDIRKGNWHFNAENLIGYRFQVNRSLSAFVGTGVRNDGYDRHDVKRNKGSASRIFDGYDEPDTEVVFNYGVTYGWLS
ncbi:MAG: MipA/OmpV family protein, partial [Pseudomonadota bacterium]